MTATQTLPVIFKKHYDRDAKTWDVTAFFPTIPADYDGTQLTCYAHTGQHGGASFPFYWAGKKCRPEEYANLLQELRGIYANDPDEPIELTVRPRMTAKMRDEFETEAKRLRSL